jgi:hypothetical protein
MRMIHLAPLASAMLLAACGGNADSDGDGTLSGEEVAAEAAGAIRPEPGLYRTSLELLELEVPGMTDQMKQQMQAQMGGGPAGSGTSTYCLTREQAAANGAEEMAKNMAQGNCTVARFDVSGGDLSAEMQCTAAGGATTHVVMDGQMTSTSSTMTMTNDMDMAGMGKMQMKARVTSERIGDCPA